MVDAFLSALLPHPWVALVLAAVAAPASLLLVRHAARRTLTQPVAMALGEERVVLAGVLCDLRRYPYLATISASDFAVHSHGSIWAALQHALGSAATVPDGLPEAEYEPLGAQLAARQDEVLAAARLRLVEGRTPVHDLTRWDELAVEGAHADAQGRDAADAGVVSAAEAVLAAGYDRNRLAGTALVLPTTDPNSTDAERPPLARVETTPSTLRRVLTAAATSLVAALIPAMAGALGHGALATGFAAASLGALLLACVVLALVDLDTLYIDVPTLSLGAGAAWLFALAAAIASGDWTRVIPGVVVVVVVIVLFEGINLLFRLLRGVDGQGFGDTLLYIATVGIPPALTGDWRLGYWSIVAAIVASAVGWGIARAAGKANRHTPFAFGPWLAAGWVLAMIWFTYESTYLLGMR